MSERLLKASVGKGCEHNVNDTLVVIKLLNKHIEHGELSHLSILSEKIEGNTSSVVHAIEEFQTKIIKLKRSDGRIDPRGKTIRALKKTPKDSLTTLIGIGNIMLNLAKRPVAGVDDALWQAGLFSMLQHVNEPDLRNYNIITLVDFRKSIRVKRLWVINLQTHSFITHTHVAHGKGSGGYNGVPQDFRDVHESFRSNLGGYVTLTRRKSKAGSLEKMGLAKRGTALTIRGLDSTNKNTKARTILFHGASYMNPPQKYKRSHGCFSTHPNENEKIISKIENGSFVYSYAGEHKKP